MADLQQSFASLDFCFFLSRKRKKPAWLRQKNLTLANKIVNQCYPSHTTNIQSSDEGASEDLDVNTHKSWVQCRS
ncbi:hypothetical protein DHW03_13230 [Pedobacter yonginense]|uniref:Uncharacterized protein n=1 Tax=Pedobacter yonginense TaxID=651869 RepID=A0A317ENV3_9SPHI|nr:hypothetical protein DHW03_13230 [Pedobacter yonginense]